MVGVGDLDINFSLPKWKLNSRTRKKWFVQKRAAYWRDSRVEKTKKILKRNSPSLWGDRGYRIRVIHRHYLRLQQENRVDETCMPEWAFKKWEWK